MQFFIVPIRDPQSAAEELNRFLASHRIVHTERQFVADGANSLWSICVSYIEGEGRLPATDKQQKKLDYREILPEAEFALFSKLRTLRKDLATQEGVPPYALFTNEQLADMVRQRVVSLAGLGQIDGVGTARVEKYGAAFLRILQEHVPSLASPVAEKNEHETHDDSA